MDKCDRPVAIFVDRENTWIVDQARRYYPNAEFTTHTTPGGTPVLYVILVSPEDVQSLQGLTVSYWAGATVQGNPAAVQIAKSFSANLADGAPVAAPFVAQWQSTLYAPQYGDYELILTSPANATAWLDEQQILNGSGKQRATVKLAQGDHTLRVQAASGSGNFNFQWQRPNASGAVEGDPTDIPASSLYLPDTVPAAGLLGAYYNGDAWTPPPVFTRVDPFIDTYFHIIPLGRPFTVDWTGQINLPSSGNWAFGLRIHGRAEVFVDDQSVVNATQPADYIEGQAALSGGWHNIRIHYLDYLGGSRIHLYWTPPGNSNREIVPTSALRPYALP